MMPICTRCGKDVDPVLEHSCTPPEVYAFEDLLKRLDKLERFNIETESMTSEVMIPRRRGKWVRFEQVKTIIGQWIADQKGGS